MSLSLWQERVQRGEGKGTGKIGRGRKRETHTETKRAYRGKEKVEDYLV